MFNEPTLKPVTVERALVCSPIPKEKMLIGDLCSRTVTGEDGLWVHLDDLGRGEDPEEEVDNEEIEEMYARKVNEQAILVDRREGWDGHAGEI